MDREAYTTWLGDLVARVAARPEVIGVVGLGSTAGTDRQPDEWSDHDVFVVTADGYAAALRNDLGWLPGAERIVYIHRETVHGRGIVFADGHLVELAVFDDHELEVARANAYRVFLDRADIGTRMATMAARTSEATTASDPDGSHRFGTFVVQVITGLTRCARGEQLSAHQRLRCFATTALIDLLGTFVPSPDSAARDRLDPHRRFEQVHPVLAAEVEAALRQPLPEVADRLVALAEEHLPGRVPAAAPAVFAAIRAVRAGMP